MDVETDTSRTCRRGNNFCWNQRTRIEKCLLGVVGIVLLAVVTATAMTTVHLSQRVPSDKPVLSQLLIDKSLRSNNERDTFQLNTSNDSVCNTIPCLKVACRLIDSLDPTVDPCKDFHKFACGGWIRHHDDGDDEVQSVMSTEMVTAMTKNLKVLLEKKDNNKNGVKAIQKARAFYKSCMAVKTIKQRGFKPAMAVLDQIGTIYDNETEWEEAKGNNNLTILLYEMFMRNGSPFFVVNYNIQSRNFSEIIISISPPTHGQVIVDNDEFVSKKLPNLDKLSDDESIHSEDDEAVEDEPSPRKAQVDGLVDGPYLYEFIKRELDNTSNKNMIKMVRKYFKRSSTDPQQEKLENEIQSFITELKKYIPLPKTLARAEYLEETDQKYTVAELNKLFVHVDWNVLLELLYGHPVLDDVVVQVSYPPYFQELQILFSNTSSRIVNNAAMALFARDVLWELVDYEEESERWKFCVEATKVVFPVPLSAMYLRSISNQDIEKMENDMDQLFENLKQIFAAFIGGNKWMDAASKTRIAQKILNMTGTFISSKYLHNDSYIEESVKNITVRRGQFLETTLSAYTQSQYENYRPNIKDQETFEKFLGLMINTFNINAYHFSPMNWVAVPLGILAPPYYINGQPQYITYGGIGSTIAHEIGHGFDATGIRRDESGKEQQWLSKRTNDNYNDRTRCFVDAYSEFKQRVSFSSLDVTLSVDGNFTLDENLADNFGLDIAYLAYKDWAQRHEQEPLLPSVTFTRDQMFFLHAAQTSCGTLTPTYYVIALETDLHTPDPERVNAMMMHSETFAEVFQCPAGSPMNPLPKCHVW